MRNTSDHESVPSGETVIVTPHGGILTFGEVMDWLGLVGTPGDFLSGPLPEVVEVGAAPAGRYAVAEAPASWSYVDACYGGLATDGAWQVLVPGSRLELDFDFGWETGTSLAHFPSELFQ